jgi:hypothetical protein
MLPMLPIDPADAVRRLKGFQRQVRDALATARGAPGLQEISRASAADTIYRLDTVVEPMLESFCRGWSREVPLVLIAEGIEGGEVEGTKVFPEGAREGDAQIRLIVDPIDGTRGLMYDKRSAWTLAGVAPNRGRGTRLRDVEVAVMTELPTGKMGWGDVLWAVKNGGAHAEREDLRRGATMPLPLRPSTADNIAHGFASVASFFPGTKVLAAGLVEHLARTLLGEADASKALVFDDQYISTGGQFFELIVGHDRFNADLRPLLYQILRQPPGLCCHPYDCATWLIAEEAGVVLTDGLSGPLDGPLDVTTGLSWAGYANAALRQKIEPLVSGFLRDRGITEWPNASKT